MGYSDPELTHNPATATIAPAAWGDAVNAAIQWVAEDHARAKITNSTSISVPNNTLTVLTMNTERRDVGGCHSTVSNTGRFTVPAGGAGDYLFTGCGDFASNSTGFRELGIRKNGSLQVAHSRVKASDVSGTVLTVATDVEPMADGDYVELVALQTSGGALNLSAVTDYAPVLTGRWLST